MKSYKKNILFEWGAIIVGLGMLHTSYNDYAEANYNNLKYHIGLFILSVFFYYFARKPYLVIGNGKLIIFPRLFEKNEYLLANLKITGKTEYSISLVNNEKFWEEVISLDLKKLGDGDRKKLLQEIDDYIKLSSN